MYLYGVKHTENHCFTILTCDINNEKFYLKNSRSPVDEVGGSINGVDDPSGIVRENTFLSRHYRLLAYEAAHQTSTKVNQRNDTRQ